MKRLVALFLSLACLAATEPLKVTGTFTSLRIGVEELGGAEFTIVVGGGGYYVIAQCAEGAPGIPEVAPAEIEGNKLTFKLSENTKSGCDDSTYRGVITPEGLKGKFDGLPTDWPGFLKRRKSYWQ